MDVIAFEDAAATDFGPLAAMRHVAALRCGAFTMLERIDRVCGGRAILWGRPEQTEWTAEQGGRAANDAVEGACRLLSAGVIWDREPELPPGSLGMIGKTVAAAHLPGETVSPEAALRGDWPNGPRVDVSDCGTPVRYPWDLVLRNGEQIAADAVGLSAFSRGEAEERFPGAHFVGQAIHFEDAGTVSIGPGAVLDATDGPIVIGEHVRIKPNATIEGPCVIGEHSLVQHHAQIHDGVTIGPWCKVGGEVEASILQGYSNKQHYGFLGHSYLGEWVNLGAGCTTSDLKNTYGPVSVPLHRADEPIDTGSLFAGLVCGDYAKLGINTAVPTGASIGVGSNVMGSRVPKHVPAMQWVVDGQMQPFDADKAVVIAERMMARRQRTLGEAGRTLLTKTVKN